ncbi:DUF2865 domain-containing protein [Xanthobacter sp. KR7-65]|uniref:DUF2865 domain-containing protein n=1 Tax=Xanthobacter sp. KR7-65 TaxID=3156612 RepID=UPI0032B5D4C2
MIRPRFWMGSRALVVSAGLLVALSGPAAAQGARAMFPVQPASPVHDFFSMLFGGGRAAPRQEAPRILVLPRAAETPSYSSSGGGIGYCVRTCDGRYFPLQGRAGGEKSDIAQCNAFCPAAKMAVYSTSDAARGIDAAVSSDGKPYSELPNAYVFRQKLVDGCTCNGKVGGMAKVDVKEDATLKRGDIVMTEEGSRVFTGSRKGPPYREADFVTPARFPELPRAIRARLDELKVASR